MNHIQFKATHFRHLNKNGKANSGIIGVVIGIAVAAIALIIGLRVFASVDSTTTGLTGAANTSYTAVVGDIYDAFVLAPIIITVLIAGTVIAILVRFSGGGV